MLSKTPSVASHWPELVFWGSFCACHFLGDEPPWAWLLSRFKSSSSIQPSLKARFMDFHQLGLLSRRCCHVDAMSLRIPEAIPDAAYSTSWDMVVSVDRHSLRLRLRLVRIPLPVAGFFLWGRIDLPFEDCLFPLLLPSRANGCFLNTHQVRSTLWDDENLWTTASGIGLADTEEGPMLQYSWQRLWRELSTALCEPKLSFRTPLTMAPPSHYCHENRKVLWSLAYLTYHTIRLIVLTYMKDH